MSKKGLPKKEWDKQTTSAIDFCRRARDGFRRRVMNFMTKHSSVYAQASAQQLRDLKNVLKREGFGYFTDYIDKAVLVGRGKMEMHVASNGAIKTSTFLRLPKRDQTVLNKDRPYPIKRGNRSFHKKPSEWTEKDTRQVIRASHAELGLLSVDQQGRSFSRPKPRYHSPVSWKIVDDGSALVTCRCNRPESEVKIVLTLENLKKILKDVKGAPKKVPA